MRRLLLALALLAPSAARADDPPSLEAGLVREARPILDALRAENVTNVGVLKFLLARDGDKKFSDALGPLNTLLARRLEVALVVRNSRDKTVGVIEDAGAVAAKTPGASHLSRDGLAKLFAADYVPAWGKGPVKAGGFLTGNGTLSADRRTLTLSVVLLTPAGKPKILADQVVLRLRPEHLAEAGDSFTRGAFGGDDGAGEPAREDVAKREDAAAADAAKVRQEAKPHPLRDPAAPFTLDLVYDGKVQPVEFRDGQAWVPEAVEGQTVAVRYARRDATAKTFLVVIKVNGENTIGREKLPDDQARVWVISPKVGRGPWDLAGFQVTNDQLQRFRVASRAESKAREVDYGTDVRTVSMTVFAARAGKAPGPTSLAGKDEQLVKRGELPAGGKKGTFAEMQDDLYADLNAGAGLNRRTGGLIVEGDRVASKVEVVEAERDPTPVMAATIHYYRK